jgi:hypothetical protein
MLFLLSAEFLSPSRLTKQFASQVMLWLDANHKTVWRSENQGKSWSPVDNVPKEALGLIQHPFDENKVKEATSIMPLRVL